MAIPERVLIENIRLKDIFKKEFLDLVSANQDNIFPVNVMFIHESEKDGKKQAYPVILSHSNNDEVLNGKLHLDSPNLKILNKFIKALESQKGDFNE